MLTDILVSLGCRVDAESRSHLVVRAVESISSQLPHLLSRFSGVSKLVLKGERATPSISDRDLLTVAKHCPQLKKLKLKYCKLVSL